MQIGQIPVKHKWYEDISRSNAKIEKEEEDQDVTNITSKYPEEADLTVSDLESLRQNQSLKGSAPEHAE